jgi:hypothetical protein
MFPWQANPSPEMPPAQSMHLPPVNVAEPPLASTIPTCRSSRPSSAPVTRRTASSAETPPAIWASPQGP